MADLLSYALASVSDVKESLNIDSGDNSKNNLIIRKINQATLNIETFCNLARDHHFKLTTYTNEIYTGSGSDQLTLLMRPVTEISSFKRHQSSESDASYEDVESEFYYKDLSAGVINLLYDSNESFGAFSVTYTAGYETIPSDLQEACVSLASFYVENATSGTNVKKREEGARSIEYFQSQSSNSIIEELGLDDTLARYVNYTVA
jgi:hypothetical protein